MKDDTCVETNLVEALLFDWRLIVPFEYPLILFVAVGTGGSLRPPGPRPFGYCGKAAS